MSVDLANISSEVLSLMAVGLGIPTDSKPEDVIKEYDSVKEKIEKLKAENEILKNETNRLIQKSKRYKRLAKCCYIFSSKQYNRNLQMSKLFETRARENISKRFSNSTEIMSKGMGLSEVAPLIAQALSKASY